MHKGLRRTGVAAALTIGTLLAGTASASIFYVSGTVQLMVAQDTGFGANADGFVLNGVPPQGSCAANPAFSSNMLILVKDDQYGSRQYALVMAALASGTTLTVRVDDTYKNGAACFAEFIW